MANSRVMTKEMALDRLRGNPNPYPIAIGLLRDIDSWDEYHAIFAAPDEVVRELEDATFNPAT